MTMIYNAIKKDNRLQFEYQLNVGLLDNIIWILLYDERL